MANPFFTALECGELSAAVLAKQTNDVLMPFKHYLDNSINALKNKEVSCEWKPIANNRYRLRPKQRIWRVTPVSQIEVLSEDQGWFEILSEAAGTPLDENFAPQLADDVIVGKGAERERYTLEQEHFRDGRARFEVFLPELGEHSTIQWSGYQLEIRPLAAPLDGIASAYIDGQECKVKEQNGNRLTLEGYVGSQSALSINGRNTAFQLIFSLDESSLTSWYPTTEGNGWLLFSKDKPSVSPHKLEDVTNNRLSAISPTYLSQKGATLSANQWVITPEKGLTLESTGNTLLDHQTVVHCSFFPELEFDVEPVQVDEKWIQLLEKADSGDETGKSELDYFFDDNPNMKILDLTQRKRDEGFRVLKSRPEERQILITRNIKGKKNWKSEYPSGQGARREIRVSVDTSQLERQKAAINNLMNRPAVGHRPLIQLLQDRTQIQWQNNDPVPEESIDWKVLTDPVFDGCDRQRAFVSKALASSDFAILDGPPGTGKTTTILELIIQLVMDGKRVLLSASTHAAINNVLERIKDDTTLSQHIFPLRIGNESNATGVEHYQYDKLFDELRDAPGCEQLTKQLMVDASNLVCGTTIGILRLFNDKDVMLDRGEPPFDVMIIDECSKTTFQEFLVPARFARRWILVGDVRQLSPFTDREQIVANLDNLMLKPPQGKSSTETLPTSVQLACFLLEELRGDNCKPYGQPMLVPVSAGTLVALKDEVQARMGDRKLGNGLESILLIQSNTRSRPNENWVVGFNVLSQEPWRLYEANLCFVDGSVLADLQSMIPDDMLVLHPSWHRSPQALLHKRFGTGSQGFRVKHRNYTDTVEIQEELLDRINKTKWSEEVCWRLEREYWLRLSRNNSKTKNVTDTLDRLFPKSIQADGRIHILKNIAFPSVLEALSGDGLQRRKKADPTTLNQGFKPEEKDQRYTTLTFQHRMHPDISTFPREQFYPPGVLEDGRKTSADRAWGYDRYTQRSVWVNIEGETFGNANKKEAEALVHELKVFCDWAEGRSKNDKGEPFDVAVLTFYKGQEKALREELKNLPGDNKNRHARFSYKNVSIKLATVDYFQGQEADVVFLSMVNTKRDGFMDSPNRLNVSITRARYQLVVVGHHRYFSQHSRTEELTNLAKACLRFEDGKANHNARKASK